ncbi:MAG: aspartate aminotransferase family protein [Chloroflexi bacterium]|nr:aspartate aminotransferase family protein [Chloroflexota bacterium]
MDTANTAIDWDREHILHPLYRVGENNGVVIDEGRGAVLRDRNGKEYLDFRAQLACVNLGYGRREIVDAIAEQMNKLPYTTIFHGFSNSTVIECAQRLAGMTPAGLAHFVFTSGGSETIESAFKIARSYWHFKGKAKYKIISLYDSYHGMTLGALAATGMGNGNAWSGAGPLPGGFIHIPSYDCYHCAFGKAFPGCDIQCARFLGATIAKEGPDSVAAFIAEPLLGVSGMIPPPPEYWPLVRKICSEHKVLLIADEVMTGFGRTGKPFAVEHWGITPDILAMAKGITSAYLPFGAAAFNDEIFNGLKGNVMLGLTYSGHPACAAAALKTMEIYVKEGVAENAARVGRHMLDRLNGEFNGLPCVDNVGGIGLMLGMNIVRSKTARTPFPPAVTAEVEKRAMENGLLVRCMNAATTPGSRVALTPPLTITLAEADRALDILKPILAGLKAA